VLKQISEVHGDTLAGDVRDMLLTHIRSMETPWSKLSERDQEYRIDACENAAKFLVSQVCALMAKQDFPNILVSVGKFTVDKAVKIEAIASSSADNINQLAVHGKGAAMLILADPQDYFGVIETAKGEADEPELPMAVNTADEPGAGALPEHTDAAA
jgi:hypothetical protein